MNIHPQNCKKPAKDTIPVIFYNKFNQQKSKQLLAIFIWIIDLTFIFRLTPDITITKTRRFQSHKQHVTQKEPSRLADAIASWCVSDIAFFEHSQGPTVDSYILRGCKEVEAEKHEGQDSDVRTRISGAEPQIDVVAEEKHAQAEQILSGYEPRLSASHSAGEHRVYYGGPQKLYAERPVDETEFGLKAIHRRKRVGVQVSWVLACCL